MARDNLKWKKGSHVDMIPEVPISTKDQTAPKVTKHRAGRKPEPKLEAEED